MNCNKEYNNKKCGGILKRKITDGIITPFSSPLYFCNKCGKQLVICESGTYSEPIIYSESIPIKLHK